MTKINLKILNLEKWLGSAFEFMWSGLAFEFLLFHVNKSQEGFGESRVYFRWHSPCPIYVDLV